MIMAITTMMTAASTINSVEMTTGSIHWDDPPVRTDIHVGELSCGLSIQQKKQHYYV